MAGVGRAVHRGGEEGDPQGHAGRQHRRPPGRLGDHQGLEARPRPHLRRHRRRDPPRWLETMIREKIME